ncbi:MAG TPA: hypothetical protein VND91_00315 [Candidatus Saccharimonadia bacterium]|nr:hypothetical protein [Candidatus Saccharimonadia bacterium]
MGTEAFEPGAPSPSGTDLARRALELGLAVTRTDGSLRAIPIGSTPVVVDTREIERRRVLATQLVEATARAARHALEGPDRIRLLGAMRPVERRLVEATWRGLDRLATARVDFSVLGNALAALEVNTTIPAMQGYSDIAARAYIEHAGASAGMTPAAIEALIVRNGSNADALRVALEESLRAHDPDQPLRTVALLCRRGDAQATELQWLRARFEAAGLDAAIVHPDEVESADPFSARGRAWQLVYRHLFASRLDDEPAPAVEAALANWNGGASLVVNPPSAHLEMKGTFAILSTLLADEAAAAEAGITPHARASLRDAVPWTRWLDPGPSDLPGGERTRDLAAAIAAAPEHYVIKRSWSYGGTGVFVGAEAHDEVFATRLTQAFGGAIRDWAALCAHAARDGRYVVQVNAPTGRVAMSLHTPDATASGDMRVDYAAFASLGTSGAGWGGVVRAAPSAIVNIVGGGGVVPILRREVDDALKRAAARP